VNLFVNTLLATSRGTGAVSWRRMRSVSCALPIGVFGVSIGTAVRPRSPVTAVGDTAGIRDTVSRGLRMMVMLNVPATFGLVVLATPIVRCCSNADIFAG
jgi:putative peptidoglycan lipid II flippase